MLKPLACVMAMASLCATWPAYATQYTVTDLGVGFAFTDVDEFGYFPQAINDAGEVLASVETQLMAGSDVYYSRPSVWNGSAWLQMPEISGREGSGWTYWANRLNNSGLVVGGVSRTVAEFDDSINADYRGFVWNTRNNTVTLLNAPPYGAETSASAINNAGRIVGTMGTSGTGLDVHAMTWENGVYTDLSPGLEAGSSLGEVINTQGAVAGEHIGPDGTIRAFYQNGATVAYLLPSQGGSDIEVLEMNESGLVVFNSETACGDAGCTDIGVIWDAITGTAIEIPHNPWAMLHSAANGVNDLGQVVGRGPDGGAMIWDAVNGIQSLQAYMLTSTLGLWEGADINNAGVIVGYGGLLGDTRPDSEKEFRILLLTPVPEPGTYALMLAGLGVLAGLVKRKP